MHDSVHEITKFLLKTSIVVLLGYELFNATESAASLSFAQMLMPGIFFGGILYNCIASPLVEGVDRHSEWFVDWFRHWIAQAP